MTRYLLVLLLAGCCQAPERICVGLCMAEPPHFVDKMLEKKKNEADH